MSSDLQIFVTGIVGRAMGSGQFTDPTSIAGLTKEAVAAFQEHLAPHLAKETSAPSPAPSAAQGHQRAPSGGGNNDVPPESKSFSLWGGDKSYIFGRNEAIWADLHGEAREGNQETLELLTKAAAASLGKDPKWHTANARRIGRAKAILAMLKNG
jgi:hypothetical protein